MTVLWLKRRFLVEFLLNFVVLIQRGVRMTNFPDFLKNRIFLEITTGRNYFKNSVITLRFVIERREESCSAFLKNVEMLYEVEKRDLAKCGKIKILNF